MAVSSNKVSAARSAKAKQKVDVTTARAERAKEIGDKAEKEAAPARSARETRNEYLRKEQEESRQAAIDEAADAEESSKKKANKVHLLDGKPGSGSGLKPGDLFAPKSNPGAAAAVPSQPLQPESMQSHGKGILYDKDIDNPPYDTGDPLVTDEGPSGTRGEEATRAEAKKAEKASSKFKTQDPDNPTIGVGGKGDATASPLPIGSRNRSKTDRPGGSNSGS